MNIILCGPGRSGTTLTSQLFSFHPELSWISGWVNKYPTLPQLSIFNAIYQSQFLGINWADVKFAPKPAEAYGFWSHYFPPFTSEQGTVSDQQLQKVRSCLQTIKKVSNKPHFVTKITGETRSQILNPLFEDRLLWIWIERDPRVVVSSYIKQKWGYKKNLQAFNRMSLKEKIRLNCNRYMHFYKDSKKLQSKKLLFYENLCQEPEKFFKELFTDLNISLYDRQKRIINEWDIRQVSWYHYKDQYSKEEQDLLTELLNEPLLDYGYINNK